MQFSCNSIQFIGCARGVDRITSAAASQMIPVDAYYHYYYYLSSRAKVRMMQRMMRKHADFVITCVAQELRAHSAVSD